VVKHRNFDREDSFLADILLISDEKSTGKQLILESEYVVELRSPKILAFDLN